MNEIISRTLYFINIKVQPAGQTIKIIRIIYKIILWRRVSNCGLSFAFNRVLDSSSQSYILSYGRPILLAICLYLIGQIGWENHIQCSLYANAYFMYFSKCTFIPYNVGQLSVLIQQEIVKIETRNLRNLFCEPLVIFLGF